MKKILITLILALMLIAGCVANNGAPISGEPSPSMEPIDLTTDKTDIYDLTLEEAGDINQKCNLGLEYMSFSTLTEEKAKEYGSDHPEMTYTNDHEVQGYYFNYPWNSADRRLTQIRINGGGYDFYGIMVGDDVSEVEAIMVNLGYMRGENIHYPDTATEVYTKYHVYIVFETNLESTEIISILVSTLDPSLPEITY